MPKYARVATKKASKKTLTASKLAKRELATMAVFLLGGDRKFVDTEDVAIQAAKLAPKAFSWRKYPDQINLELVRAVLSDAKKRQFGALLQGSGMAGWRLSDSGVVWALGKGRAALLGKGHLNMAPWAGSRDTRRIDNEFRRVRTSEAWAQWLAGRKVTANAAKVLFRIDDYATAEMRDRKVARLRSAIGADADATRFLDAAVSSLRN